MLKSFRPSPGLNLVIFYVTCNFYALILFTQSGVTLGELGGFAVSFNELLFIFITIVASYLAIYFLYGLINVGFAAYLGGNSLRRDRKDSVIIDIFVLIVQCILLYHVISQGAYTAGKSSPEGWVSIFSTLLVPDGLFLAYYSKYRSSRWFPLVALVWTISMVLRGWGGALFIIAVAEYGWFSCQKRKNYAAIIILLLIFIIISPYIHLLRQIIRGQEVLLNGVGIGGLIAVLSDERIRDSAIASGPGLIEAISLRFEHLSSTYIIKLNEVELSAQLQNGSIKPFYQSLPIVRSIMESNGVDFTQYLSRYSDGLGDWYIHTGMVGWLMIAPYLTPLFMGFIALSIFLLIILLKIDRRDCEFTAYMGFAFCLIYLVFGWYSVFFAVVQGSLLIVLFNFIQPIFRGR